MELSFLCPGPGKHSYVARIARQPLQDGDTTDTMIGREFCIVHAGRTGSSVACVIE